jgi:hypothetical protein
MTRAVSLVSGQIVDERVDRIEALPEAPHVAQGTALLPRLPFLYQAQRLFLCVD